MWTCPADYQSAAQRLAAYRARKRGPVDPPAQLLALRNGLRRLSREVMMRRRAIGVSRDYLSSVKRKTDKPKVSDLIDLLDYIDDEQFRLLEGEPE